MCVYVYVYSSSTHRLASEPARRLRCHLSPYLRRKGAMLVIDACDGCCRPCACVCVCVYVYVWQMRATDAVGHEPQPGSSYTCMCTRACARMHKVVHTSLQRQTGSGYTCMYTCLGCMYTCLGCMYTCLGCMYKGTASRDADQVRLWTAT